MKRGKNCKDFEKWPDECSRYDASKCFTFYFTSEFKYKTLSIAGELFRQLVCIYYVLS